MRKYLFGISIIGGLTLISWLLAQAEWAKNAHLSALTLAILCGILLGNSLYSRLESVAQEGVNFSKTTLLRAGIVLYGFRITVQQIGDVGVNAILCDAIMLICTFFITLWLGVRWLKMDKQLVQLTAAGCSICGAAAIMATAPVVKGESHKVSVAVALIVIFGTVCMFLYPILYGFLDSLLSPHQFGIYIGSSVHEVAQVYAAGGNISADVADAAVITKMIRVMMLAPFLLALAFSVQRQTTQGSQQKITIPWFALWFIAVALFNSLNLLPETWVQYLISLDTLLLMMAMSALGLTTKISSIKQAGLKPLLLGALVCLWLVIGGFAMNMGAQWLFN